MREHYASPIPEEDLESFAGLAYFDVDRESIHAARFVPEQSSKMSVASTSGMASDYTRLGVVEVSIEGEDYELVVLDDGDGGAFIPFRDETCGDETYEGGRYLAVDIEAGREITLDFNLAHNAWCVYDDEFVCPLPPPQNRIATPIRAGEKAYERSRGPEAP